MSTANRWVLWGLGLLLVSSLAWYSVWFVNHHERQTEVQRVGLSPQAQRNPFLAAERFLLALGYQSESFRARDLISRLPSPDDVLLLRRMQPDLSAQQLERLKAWLSAGGRLIMTPPPMASPTDINDAFLADLGVGLVSSHVTDSETDIGIDSMAEPQAETADEPSARTGYQTINILLAGEIEPVQVSFRRQRYLQDQHQWATEQFGVGGAQYLQFDIGQGRLIVLSDLNLFTNERIGQLDHAYLLSHLVQGKRKVWLQYAIDAPPLPQMLWQKMPFVIVTIMLLLLLMGWRLFLYTGPRLNLQQTQRRNLLEHIDATAHYAWRIDKGRRLFEQNRKALEQAWRQRHPNLNRMDNQQRAEWLSEQTGMTAAAVKRSLYQDITQDQDFIKATLVLQQLASGLTQRELK